MLKRFTSAAVVAATLFANVHVAVGATETSFADSDADIARAETLLNSVVAESRQRELQEIAATDTRQIPGKPKAADILKMIAARKEELLKIKSYKDLTMAGSFEDTVRMVKERGYPLEESAVELFREIDRYKRDKNVNDPVAVLKYFDAKAGLSRKTSFLQFSFIETAHAISYDDWRKLTTGEKLLIVSDPKAALMTDALAKLAFQWTQEKFGKNGLGDKSDGYRHGTWNALMTRDISRSWAEAYATAHEDKSQTELQQKESDGYYKYQHRNMDLNNNKVGRAQIQWYEYWWNCSDATVKSRISAKLTNKSGEIIWLHL